MIGGQVGLGDEALDVDGRVGGCFENGGAFIQLIKHGDVEHRAAPGDALTSLAPQELAAESRNGIQRGIDTAHLAEIAPTEAWKHDGQVILIMLATPLRVSFMHLVDHLRGVRGRVITTDGPGADDVRALQDLVQLRIASGIAFLTAPMPGHASHDGEFAELGIVMQEAQQRVTLIERVVASIIEADAPHGDDGLALMALIRRIIEDVQLGAQPLPVLHDHGFEFARLQSTEVIHHAPSPARRLRAVAHVLQNGVVMRAEAFVFEHGAETLEENAINAMLAHPFEMPPHRLRMRGAEHLGRSAISKLQWRLETLVSIQLRHIRPEIDVTLPRLVKPIMHPAQIRAVRRCRKPALITAHHLAGECGGIVGVKETGAGKDEDKDAHLEE